MKRKGRKKKGLNFLKKIGKAVKKLGKQIVNNQNNGARLGSGATRREATLGGRLPDFGGLLGGM